MTDETQTGLLTEDYDFYLPPELIAQVPAERRGEDRLLAMDRQTGAYRDLMISDFPSLLTPGSVMVINNSKVRKARVYGNSQYGGKVEFLFLEEREDHSWNCMVTKSKKQKVGKTFVFGNGMQGTIAEELDDGTKIVSFDRHVGEDFFLQYGHVPLPPYIKRKDDSWDTKRYQTVYASHEGSVAAPTAGLHFTDGLLDEIRKKGIEIVEVTLHVGMGTFIPMRTKQVGDHQMHFERYTISEEAAATINQARKEGRKIVAVGTTSVRTLESAYDPATDSVRSGMNRTNLFIKPGFAYRVVNQLLTNFHTPESTLLVLVSVFAGRKHILDAYAHAVEQQYHFFSYGDAMFLM
ncbi:MAG: tRNA preQ1(34) S-adenosylmethionine ribosyltransferase-isomerase QueA [Spirochaetia bacterium]|nr:tRNA preQ1(34) S-adenosylmethionine ribosyltransferase-isomerase QueA [Spirochaetia bacterium]